MLEVRDLSAGYGAINVLWNVSLSFPAGELTTIVGPNGAGKTTLLRAIMGLIPHQGEILFEGRPLRAARTWDLPALGISMVPEGRLMFRDMTVEENLCLGAFTPRCRAGFRSRLDEVYDLFPRLRERRGQTAGSLSGGEAQMVAMGRGLMSSPSLLLIDEPSLGLAPVIVNELFATLAQLKLRGVTMILVEQNTHRALAIADRVYLMRSGRVLLTEDARRVDLDTLHSLYLAVDK